MSVNINIRGAVKRYGKNTVIENLTLNIRGGEFFTLLGPSGCGKTTLLRMIAGFNSIEGGDFYFNDTRINDLNPAKRNIGMVFQNYAIFPHMNVRKNVEFGLKNRPFDRKLIHQQADKFLKLMQIDQLAERMPAQLSGGQQQRVALARALCIEPDVLLMDEPLSNLDAKLRVEMRTVIKEIQNNVGITTIYVTHDQEEALTLSDRIAVFNKGYIEQIGTPNEVYNHSQTEFVANFIGDINRLEEAAVSGLQLNPQRHHFIRLERVRVNRPKEENEFQCPGVIESREYYGLYIKYYIRAAGQAVKVIEKNDGINIYEVGDQVTVGIHPQDVMSYDA